MILFIHLQSNFKMRYQWIILAFLLHGCTISNTDYLEPHQIVSAPAHQWIHIDEDAPLDVTEEKIKTKQICPPRVED